jgi:hypothetical protein
MARLMGTHYRQVCEVHGDVLAQCRCPSKDKAETKVPCPGPPVCPQPGFRVTPCELSDDEALKAMHHGCGQITRAALDARLMLLQLGFADDHSLCEQFDRTAAEYAAAQAALRRQAQARPEDVEV